MFINIDNIIKCGADPSSYEQLYIILVSVFFFSVTKDCDSNDSIAIDFNTPGILGSNYRL